MARPKGLPKTGGGSRKGRPNKLSADLKEMILQALDGAGGVAYLQKQADNSPAAFLALVGKVLPLQLSGKDGGAIVVEIVKYDGAGDDSYAERRQAGPIIEADRLAPVLSLPQPASSPTLPAGAKDVDSETPPLTSVPLSPRRERWRI